jgi:hypothetical protein
LRQNFGSHEMKVEGAHRGKMNVARMPDEKNVTSRCGGRRGTVDAG